MPNVIAIIDDAKVRGQIEGYLKELDAEGIRLRSFSSTSEFEQKYFKKESKAAEHPLAKHAGLNAYSSEQLDFLLTQTYTGQPSMPHKIMRLKINIQTKKIETIEPNVDADKTVFDRYPEDLKNQSEAIAALIPLEFMPIWTTFWKKILTGSAQIMIPMRANTKDLCFIKMRGQKATGNLVQLQIEECTEKFKNLIEDEVRRRAQHEAETEELQLMSEIHLIIFKIDSISGKVPQWIGRIWDELRKGQFFPKDGSTRFVVLKYEDDNVSKLDVMHRHLDDLIYLPLDRLIFLQKIEIIFNLPKKTKPSFLFTQEVDLDIEISKITKLEKVSDVGLAIRNPVRLVPGLIAHFYFTLPGEPSELEVWGKVIRSDPHPEFANQFLVYFSYFALKKTDLTSIRRFMGRSGRYQAFVNSERAPFLFNPDDLYASDEDRRVKGVAILDMDEEQAAQMKGTLSKDVGQLKIAAESSYSSFIARYLTPQVKSKIDLTAVTLPTENELYSPLIALNINPETLEMNACLSAPSEEQSLLGHPGLDLFSSPKGWLKIFSVDSENINLLLEAGQLVKTGKPVVKILIANTTDGGLRALRVELKKVDRDSGVSVEITAASAEDLKRRQGKDEKLPSLDLAIVDLNLISGPVDAFLDGLTEQARQAGMILADRSLKFILMADPTAKLDVRSFTSRQIIGLITKPTDARLMAFLVSSTLNIRYSMYNFSNIGWITSLISIHVAKEAKLESLSEFGATIRHPRPLAPGTILFLRGQLFDNAPNRCLTARFYHCEDHPEHKGEYLCSMIYFGINDGFMKFARKWFRETYAHAKQVESNTKS